MYHIAVDFKSSDDVSKELISSYYIVFSSHAFLMAMVQLLFYQILPILLGRAFYFWNWNFQNVINCLNIKTFRCLVPLLKQNGNEYFGPGPLDLAKWSFKAVCCSLDRWIEEISYGCFTNILLSHEVVSKILFRR